MHLNKFFNPPRTCANAACMKKFSTCFYGTIDKNTTQKDENVQNCEFVQKYVHVYVQMPAVH